MPNFTDKIVLRKNGIDTFYEIANFIKGYLNTTNNKFYKESTFLTEIKGKDRKIYLDLNTNYLYKFDTDSSTPSFVQISGGSSGGSYTSGFGINISNLGVIKTTDFVGTQAEWDALTTTEKEAHDFVHITDDVANGGIVVVDTVTDGNMNPVTSNAVYDAFASQLFTFTYDAVDIAPNSMHSFHSTNSIPSGYAIDGIVAYTFTHSSSLVFMKSIKANGTLHVVNVGSATVNEQPSLIVRIRKII